MRQAGIIAAGALYGLDHHIDRLAEDHANARELATAIAAIEGLTLDPPDVETNIVIFVVSPKLGTAADFCARLKEAGVLMLPIAAQQVRALAHLDVSRADVTSAVEVLKRVAGELASGAKPSGNGPTGAAAPVSSAYRG